MLWLVIRTATAFKRELQWTLFTTTGFTLKHFDVKLNIYIFRTVKPFCAYQNVIKNFAVVMSAFMKSTAPDKMGVLRII